MTYAVGVDASGWSISPPIETVVDRRLGTNIGNMTLNAGLAGIFSGTPVQAGSGCGGISANPGYVGKTYVAAKAISKVQVHGPNNIGYADTGTTTSVTITLYGKNGTPSNGTDGTSLGSITFNQSASNESAARTITSTDQTTKYTSVWIYVNSGMNSHYVGQFVVYEMFTALPTYTELYPTGTAPSGHVVAILGDSIVAFMSTFQPSFPYPFNSATLLGVSGNTVAQIYARVSSIPSGATDVIIEGGTNDLVGLGTDAGIVPGYTSMIGTISTSKRIIIMGVPQVDEATINPSYLPYLNNNKISQVNGLLAALCCGHSNVIFSMPVMALSMSGKTVDGIHPNAAGYNGPEGIIPALSYHF